MKGWARPWVPSPQVGVGNHLILWAPLYTGQLASGRNPCPQQQHYTQHTCGSDIIMPGTLHSNTLILGQNSMALKPVLPWSSSQFIRALLCIIPGMTMPHQHVRDIISQPTPGGLSSIIQFKVGHGNASQGHCSSSELP